MCVICIKDKGVKMPSKDIIFRMWQQNHDGAGYMIWRNHAVEIHKGFTKLNDFLRAIQDEKITDDDKVIMHFRISTQARTREMTHPFPLTSDKEKLKALDLKCGCGIAHNGVIPMTSNGNKEYSDTALFISDYMTKILKSSKDLHDNAIKDILLELVKSKLAIMDCTGTIETIGDFTKYDGLLFSNMHWNYNFGCNNWWFQ